MRVLVTGSRDWEGQCRVWEELDLCLTDAVMNGVRLVVVHGDCPTGADRYARLWVQRRRAVSVAQGYASSVVEERYPAQWRLLGKRAGYVRNAMMVDLGADLCLAFLAPCSKPMCQQPQPHASHGASHTVALARGAGIEARIFEEG